jgi:hypothetical protein
MAGARAKSERSFVSTKSVYEVVWPSKAQETATDPERRGHCLYVCRSSQYVYVVLAVRAR